MGGEMKKFTGRRSELSEGRGIEKSLEKAFSRIKLCFSILLGIQLNVIWRRATKIISQNSWNFSVFLSFWLSWALNCHASIRFVSIRARLLLKMSNSKRTRKYYHRQDLSIFFHPIVVRIIRQKKCFAKLKQTGFVRFP